MEQSVIKIVAKDIEGKRDAKIINMEGSLDMLTSLEAEKIIIPLIEQNKYLILDCTNLKYMNTAGLVTILKFSTQMKRKNGSFKIASPSKFIYEIFDLSGLVSLLEIYPTKEEALKSIPA